MFRMLGICVAEAEGMTGGEGDGGAERLSGGCVAGGDGNGGGGYTDAAMSSAIRVLGGIRFREARVLNLEEDCVLNSIVVGSDTIRGLGSVLNNGLWCHCSGRKISGFLECYFHYKH